MFSFKNNVLASYDKLFYDELKNDIKIGYFESEYFPLSSLDNIYLSFIYDIKHDSGVR